MIRRSAAMVALALLSCSEPRQAHLVDTADERAVVAAALEDFARWDEVTFGNRQGFLALDADSRADPDASIEGVKRRAPNIATEIDDDLADSLIQKNRSPKPIADLVAGSPWGRVRQPPPEGARFFEVPVGAKANGTIWLPGFNVAGSKAIVVIDHSWSIHGATVTYVLERSRDRWRIVARDQAVYL